MPIQTHLMNRNGVYYCRVPIPKEYQPSIGKKEVWKSLGCRSYSEAVRYSKIQAERIMQEIEAVTGARKLTSEIIKTISDEHYKVILAADESLRKQLSKTSPLTDEAKQCRISANREILRELTQDLSESNWESMREIADKKLHLLGIRIPLSRKVTLLPKPSPTQKSCDC
jgi:hypothetical protein